MTILLTAFLPFRGRAENGSRLLAGSLSGRHVGGCELVARVLPVVWEGHRERLIQAIAETNPTLILGLGEGSPDLIRFEKLATNTASGADEDGALPPSPVLDPDGPPALATPLAPPAIAPGPWELVESEDAGDYLCNATLYHALRAGLPAAFLHLPILADHSHPEYLAFLQPVVEDLLLANLSATSGAPVLG